MNNLTYQKAKAFAQQLYPETSNAYLDGLITGIVFILKIHEKEMLDYVINRPDDMDNLLYNYLKDQYESAKPKANTIQHTHGAGNTKGQ